MKKLMLGLLLGFPAIAQVSHVAPTPSVNVDSRIAPAAPGGFDAGLRDATREPIPGKSLYRWSLATVVIANGVDAASSWRNQEANPLVAGSGSQFGFTSIAIKSGFVATSLLIQHVALRHRPDLYKKLGWMNFATAGVLGGVAKYNLGVR